jgi:hypothetical protein
VSPEKKLYLEFYSSGMGVGTHERLVFVYLPSVSHQKLFGNRLGDISSRP